MDPSIRFMHHGLIFSLCWPYHLTTHRRWCVFPASPLHLHNICHAGSIYAARQTRTRSLRSGQTDGRNEFEGISSGPLLTIGDHT